MSDKDKGGKASATRSTLGIFATKLAIYPLSFVVTVGIVRELGNADYGKYSYLRVMLAFLLPMLSLGFGQGITYLIGSEKYRPRDVQLTTVALGFVFGVFTATIVYALWRIGILTALEEMPPDLMLVALTMVPVRGINLMLYRMSMGASWFTVMNMLDIARFTVTPVVLALFVFVFRWALPGAVYALVAREVIILLITAGLVLRRSRPAWRFSTQFVGEGGHYGLRAWSGDISARANTRLDHFLLGSFADDAVYALYNVAAKVTELLWMPTNALGPVLFNRIARVKDKMERMLTTEQIHRTAFLAIALAGIALGATLPWLIPFVFGPDRAGAVWPALILIPGTLVVVTQKVLTKFFGGSGEPGKSSITTIVGTIVLGTLSALLIPVMQATGAAWASTLGYTSMSVTAYLLYRRRIKPRKPTLFRIRKGDAIWAYRRILEAIGVWRAKINRTSSATGK